jgi:hypothetical protein
VRSENSRVSRINNDSNLFRGNIAIIDFDRYLPLQEIKIATFWFVVIALILI